MTTEQKLELTKDAIGNVLAHHRAAYVNGMAIRGLITEKEPGFMFNLNVHGTPQPLNIPNCAGHIYNYLQTDHGRDFLALRAAHEVSEKNPDFIEAFAILDPLVSEYRRLQSVLVDEAAERGAKTNALREAEATALAKAQAIADADPAVIAARAALAKLEPTPDEPTPDIVLTRGKITPRKLEAV